MTYRNPALLDLARHAPRCFCCGKDNAGTVVAAHSNLQVLGKGMGIKAADIPAFLCHVCHDLVDGRDSRWDRVKRTDEWYRAAVLSMRWALENHPEVFR